MNITSPRSVKYEIYKDKQYKKALTSYNRKTRELSRGLEEKAQDGPLMILRFGYATLISNMDPNTIQDPESGHEGTGESES